MTVLAANDVLSVALAPFAEDWADSSVEDIFVNRPCEYFVRRGAKMERREAPELDALAIEALVALIAHLRGQDAGENAPILDAELPSGERINAVLYPCTPAGEPSMALRRASEALPSLDELESQGLFSGLAERLKTGAEPVSVQRRANARTMLANGQIKDLLRYCITNRWTTVISGETGSGKSHNLTAMAMEIGLDERIVTVANADETRRLPHRNRASFLYSKQGGVTAEMLIDAALRNAPRWLLVQEIRGGESFSFLRAVASGHPGITTVHAPSAALTFDTISVGVRQHPAGARIPEDTLRAMLRAFIDVVMHVERGPGGVFRVTDVVFGWDQT
jgi:type IV secretion system protein VirB11